MLRCVTHVYGAVTNDTFFHFLENSLEIWVPGSHVPKHFGSKWRRNNLEPFVSRLRQGFRRLAFLGSLDFFFKMVLASRRAYNVFCAFGLRVFLYFSSFSWPIFTLVVTTYDKMLPSLQHFISSRIGYATIIRGFGLHQIVDAFILVL